MRIAEALRRIVLAPVLAGALIVTTGLALMNAPEPHVPVYDNACNVLFLGNADCPEDTIGWIGSSEDDRVNKA